MGLFDKKKKQRDDFDSPVEEIDLGGGTTIGPAPGPGFDADQSDAAERASAAAAWPAPAGSRARPARVARESERAGTLRTARDYGIDDAIALMRTLPVENIELVVQVVKHTLQSARIDVGRIIEDATAKQQGIEGRVKVLRDAIEDLEREIETRRTEIGQLEADHRETTRVKERLILAEKLTRGTPEAIPDITSSGEGEPAADGRGAESPTAPAQMSSGAALHSRHRSTSPPPISVTSSSAGGATPAGDPDPVASPNHVASGNQLAPGPLGAGGPAGSLGAKASSPTVVSRK